LAQQLNAAKKDIFNLQLENHFLKERLANMAPDHIEAALKENVRLKLEILNLSKEMKKVKKLLTQQDRDLGEALRERETTGRGGKESREVEEMYRDERDRRRAAEAEVLRLQAELDNAGQQGGDENVDALRAQIEDTEASEAVWKQRTEQLEEELENAKAVLDDKDEELERLRDAGDRAQEEVEKLRAGLDETAGLSKGRDGKAIHQLEQENAVLQAELDQFKQSSQPADIEELEEVSSPLLGPILL
jgi:chromosome segregation ATPase